MANRMPAALPGTLIASAFGAIDGVAASSDANAGRSQVNIWARAAIVQSVGLGFGIYGVLDARARSWTEPVLLASAALMARTAAFALSQQRLPKAQMAQGYAQRNYSGGNGGVTPPTIYVYGDPRNKPEQQAGGML